MASLSMSNPTVRLGGRAQAHAGLPQPQPSTAVPSMRPAPISRYGMCAVGARCRLLGQIGAGIAGRLPDSQIGVGPRGAGSQDSSPARPVAVKRGRWLRCNLPLTSHHAPRRLRRSGWGPSGPNRHPGEAPWYGQAQPPLLRVLSGKPCAITPRRSNPCASEFLHVCDPAWCALLVTAHAGFHRAERSLVLGGGRVRAPPRNGRAKRASGLHSPSITPSGTPPPHASQPSAGPHPGRGPRKALFPRAQWRVHGL